MCCGSGAIARGEVEGAIVEDKKRDDRRRGLVLQERSASRRKGNTHTYGARSTSPFVLVCSIRLALCVYPLLPRVNNPPPTFLPPKRAFSLHLQTPSPPRRHDHHHHPCIGAIPAGGCCCCCWSGAPCMGGGCCCGGGRRPGGGPLPLPGGSMPVIVEGILDMRVSRDDARYN